MEEGIRGSQDSIWWRDLLSSQQQQQNQVVKTERNWKVGGGDGGNNKGEGEVSSGKPAEQSAKPASEPPKQDYIHVRARRGQATDSHSLAERVIFCFYCT